LSSGHQILECDVLIIGSGAGGATLSDALTKAGRDVLMLEEGPDIPVSEQPSVSEGIRRMWRYGGLTAALGAPPVSYAEGCCVGGGTEVNSAIMQRAPDALLTAWASRYRINDYGPEQLAPYYEEAETLINACATPPPHFAATTLLRNGAHALAWQVTDLKRAQKDGPGIDLRRVDQIRGGKQTMRATALPAALARGMRLVPDCRVQRLAVRNALVTKVFATARNSRGGGRHLTIYPQYVFVCAGAVHGPALLQRSSIRRQVGKTLRMHPTIKAHALFDSDVQAEQSPLPLCAITEFMPDQRLGGSMNFPGYLAMSLAEDWQRRKWLWQHRTRIGMYYAMTRGEACGSVVSMLGLKEPLVFYQVTPRDRENLRQGLLHLTEALFAAGARFVGPSIYGHAGWHSFDEARRSLSQVLAKEANLVSLHLMSSCPIGEDRTRCAVNSTGRLFGISNLYVADASQIPEAPGTNPQLTVMAQSLRTAAHFLSASQRDLHQVALREET
jgi:choline dehydrogenase-like flavoprotein